MHETIILVCFLLQFRNLGLLQARGCWTFTIVGFQESVALKEICIPVMFEVVLFLKDSLRNRIRGDHGNAGIEASDGKVDDVDGLERCRRVVVNGCIPDHMTHCRHQHGKLKDFDNHSIERRAQVDWVGETPEEVILVDPELKEEDEDEDRSGQWDQYSIE